MLKEQLQQIDQHKSKLASLQQALLRDLHSLVGFASRSELVQELQGLGRAKGKKKAAKKVKKPAAKKAVKRRATKKSVKKPAAKKVVKKRAAKKAGGRRKRTTITPELRNDIVAAIKGGATGAAVAKQFGVSVPTVQNIKKAAGLTKKG